PNVRPSRKGQMRSLVKKRAAATMFAVWLSQGVALSQSSPPCAKVELRLAEKTAATGLPEVFALLSTDKVFLHAEHVAEAVEDFVSDEYNLTPDILLVNAA